MPALLGQEGFSGLDLAVDERRARQQLRQQIARLEAELNGLFAEAFGHTEVPHRVEAVSPEPRLLDLGELEGVRDELADRVAEARLALVERRRFEEERRQLVDRMLAAPQDFKWVRVSREELGLPGCGHWHSKPRLGPIGMLMGWWRVKISSGCPLAGRLAAVEHEVETGTEAGLRAGRASAGAVGVRAPCRAGDPRRDRLPGDRGLRR
ncbi:MAG TPA: hypothetical protein VFU16_10210 [Solirubrobacterales bacterium]|nr:hypothetical protein [Solirubrobacterales bacterium]